ncbi:MAG TPA: polymer-forming cytoskeletal protein [Chitinophagaceae bacterium]|nr:polymer-forming cytoskeletal protein [Chitinophagaceae bacterium]
MLSKLFSKPVNTNSFLLAEGLVINGNIASNVPGRIDCVVKGDIMADDKLVIGKTGNITGNLKVGNLVLEGTVYGNIICTGKAVVTASASLTGTIAAKTILVDPEAMIYGNITKYNEGDTIPILGTNNNYASSAEKSVLQSPVIKMQKKQQVVEPASNANSNSWF